MNNYDRLCNFQRIADPKTHDEYDQMLRDLGFFPEPSRGIKNEPDILLSACDLEDGIVAFGVQHDTENDGTHFHVHGFTYFEITVLMLLIKDKPEAVIPLLRDAEALTIGMAMIIPLYERYKAKQARKHDSTTI